MQVYCWVEPAMDKTTGQHCEMNHREMTLWAKHMVSNMILAAKKKNSRDVGTRQDNKVPATKYKDV